jgi:hypothetical protein
VRRDNDIVEEITAYRKRCRDHVDRMGAGRWSKIALNCAPTGLRVRGQTSKKLERYF